MLARGRKSPSVEEGEGAREGGRKRGGARRGESVVVVSVTGVAL
jgi:hypothetical protein